MKKYVLNWHDEQTGDVKAIFINNKRKELLDYLNDLGLFECLEQCDISVSISEEADSIVDIS